MLLNEERLLSSMARHDLDAVVATTPENVTYLSGFWAMPQWIRRGPQAYVLFPRAGSAAATVVTSSATLDLVADQEIWAGQFRRYGDFHVVEGPELSSDPTAGRQAKLHKLPDDGDALTALIVAISEAGLTRARIGIDEIGLLPGATEMLQQRLRDVEWRPSSALFRGVRAVKTGAEVARLREAAHTAERSVKAALSVARIGATELDLARAFHTRTVLEDGSPILGCIGFGERSALMNVQPSRRALRAGDVIRFDVGGRHLHYRADIARIATMGDPSAEVRRYYNALLRGVERAYELIRPGALASDIFEAVVATVQKEGIPHYRRNHVGHGIGLDGYDEPSLSPASADRIEAGMVLCVETPYYELGRWGLQVEDMVVVRDDGVERLMLTDGQLAVVPS